MVGLRESLREILRVGVGPDQYLIERVRLLACVQEESVANGIITDWILTDEARRSLAAALRRRVPHGAHSSLARDESLDQNQEVVRTCANDDLAEAVALVLAVQFIADG